MKNILITGANKGIGLETARQLAQQGHSIFLGSRNRERGQEALAQLQQEGLEHINLVELDVSNPSSIEEARQQLESQMDHLDILINNAGIAGPQDQELLTMDTTELRTIFETNFFGPLEVAKQFLPLLEKGVTPRIINVSSELGSLNAHWGTDRPNYFVYNAYSTSKTALNALTVHWGKELKAKGITVASVTPGYTATDLNQHQGFKTVAQGAGVIVRHALLPASELSQGYYGEQGALSW